jgi:hypothetical protein
MFDRRAHRDGAFHTRDRFLQGNFRCVHSESGNIVAEQISCERGGLIP